VLSHLPGVTNREIKESAMLIHSETLGTRVRLPNPITCLKAKAHNLTRIKQDKRQDYRQVQIMVLCCRAFLRDVIAQVEAGQITEGAARAPFEALLKWTRSATARKATRSYPLDWSKLFPVPELEASLIPSLRQFRQKRLPNGDNSALPLQTGRFSRRRHLGKTAATTRPRPNRSRGGPRSKRQLDPSRNGV
jgi:hypothetical protein